MKRSNIQDPTQICKSDYLKHLIRLSAKLHFNKLKDKEQNGNLVENNDCRSWATIEKFDI